jgi:hypothetical protein
LANYCRLCAIIFNIVCVVAVWQRKLAMAAGDPQSLKKARRLLLLGGYGFMPSFVAALVLAVLMLI